MWQTFTTWLADNIGGLAIRVLTSLGIGYFTYNGAEYLADQAKAVFQAQLSGIPADIVALLGMAGVGKFLAVILSAYAIAFTYTLSGSVLKSIGSPSS